MAALLHELVQLPKSDAASHRATESCAATAEAHLVHTATARRLAGPRLCTMQDFLNALQIEVTDAPP